MPNIYTLTYRVHGVLAKENLELPKLHNPQNIKVDAPFLYPIAGECLPPPPTTTTTNTFMTKNPISFVLKMHFL